MNLSLYPSFKRKIIIVTSTYYPEIENLLSRSVINELKKNNYSYEVIKVLGVLEIPTAVSIHYEIIKKKKLLDSFSGYIALGCVIRGETSHYDIVSNESANALVNFSINNCIPIGNGILTVNDMDQALVRADPNQRNNGAHAAKAVVELINQISAYK